MEETFDPIKSLNQLALPGAGIFSRLGKVSE